MLNERVARLIEETPPSEDECHERVLGTFAAERALVKTVSNDGWADFCSRLMGSPFRTPTTLPPLNPKHMHLFGKATASSVGLVWDLRELNLSDAFIWPSGYYAKSEHNVMNGILLNGRKEALVSLDRLWQDNRALTYFSEAHGQPVVVDVLPWNEVFVRLHGARGLVAIFSRSTNVAHLLLAMGVRDMIVQRLSITEGLPLLILDEGAQGRGVRPFGRLAQEKVLRLYASHLEHPIFDPPSHSLGVPRLPIDCQGVRMHALLQLRLHGVHGLTDGSLRSLAAALLLTDGTAEATRDAQDSTSFENDMNGLCALSSRLRELPRACRAWSVLACGLQACVAANNAAAAESLLLTLAPFLSSPVGLERQTLTFATAASAKQQPVHAPGPGAASRGSHIVATVCSAPSRLDASVRSDVGRGLDLAALLRHLMTQSLSPRLHVVLGAALLLDELLSRRLLQHIKEVCKELEEWLMSSESLTFRLMSWRQLRQERQFSRQESPSIYAFISRDAIKHRMQFHAQLLHLQDCLDLKECLKGVHELVTKLHHPSERLQTLRYLLGLDEGDDLETVAGITQLSLKAFTQIHTEGAETSGPTFQEMAADAELALNDAVNAPAWGRATSAP